MVQSQVTTLVVLLMVAGGVAIVVKLIPVPYVTAMAIVGAVGGIVLHTSPLHLTQSLILFILLPGLLFEAGFNLRWGRLVRSLASVILLATVGVVLTALIVMILGHFALGLSLAVAFLLGAMVAATDPVAVLAVFRKLPVPVRLQTIVEAESLFNDGTGVVLFTLALGAVGSGNFQTVPAFLGFLRLVLGGVAIGLAIGFLLSRFTMRLDDPQVEITLTMVAAYGGYLLAERLQLSGILAVVAAAMVLGNYGRPSGMSERTQQAVSVFWDYVAFLLNSLVFVLIGLELPSDHILHVIGIVVLAFAITLAARAVAVYLIFGLLTPLGRRISWRWQHLLVWSGMRGAVAIALALSLSGQNGRAFQLLSLIVYGVALLSIIIQGITIAPVSRFLLPLSCSRRPAAGADGR